jgi:hypothetical protein
MAQPDRLECYHGVYPRNRTEGPAGADYLHGICTCSSGWYIAREEGHSQQVFMVEHGGGQPKYDVGAFCPMGKKLPVQTKCVSQSVCI